MPDTENEKPESKPKASSDLPTWTLIAYEKAKKEGADPLQTIYQWYLFFYPEAAKQIPKSDE